MEKDPVPSYYEILNVSVDATKEAIHSAYSEAREVFRENSLASYGLANQEELRKTLEELDLAYSILSIPKKRKEYDLVHGVIRNKQKKKPDLVTTAKKEENKNIYYGYRYHYILSKYEKNPEMENKIDQATEVDGSFLKEIREYKNITLEQIEELTKIPRKNLIRIEEDNRAALPCFAYVQGFVKQYAKALCLDPEKISKSYMQNMQKKGAW